MRNYRDALNFLFDLVEAGVEYPEAHTRACVCYKVDGETLSKLYEDWECGE